MAQIGWTVIYERALRAVAKVPDKTIMALNAGTLHRFDVSGLQRVCFGTHVDSCQGLPSAAVIYRRKEGQAHVRSGISAYGAVSPGRLKLIPEILVIHLVVELNLWRFYNGSQ